MSTPDFKTQESTTKALVKMIYDDATIVPLWVTPTIVVKSKSVKDDNHLVVHNNLWTPENAWLSKQ